MSILGSAPTIPLKNSFTTFIPSFYDSIFGEALYPNLYFYGIGAKRKVPLNMGTTIKIARLRRQTGVVSLQGPSGIADTLASTNPSKLCSQFVSGTLQKFAGWYANSDLVMLTSQGDVTQLALRDIARDLALQMDIRCRTKISADGFGIWAGVAGVSTGGANTTSGKTHNNAALKISDIVNGVIRLQAYNNPRPADGYFPCVTHPATMFDIQNPSTLSSGYGGSWVDVNKYATDATVEQIYRGEVGRAYGARFVTTTNAKRLLNTGGMSAMVSGNKTSGFQTYIFAPESFYVVESDGMTARTIVKGLGSGGTFDPDNSLATVAAKVYFEAIRGFQVTTASPTVEYRYARLIHSSSIHI
jgi:N4-gp56 family major capsid protein